MIFLVELYFVFKLFFIHVLGKQETALSKKNIAPICLGAGLKVQGKASLSNAP